MNTDSLGQKSKELQHYTPRLLHYPKEYWRMQTVTGLEPEASPKISILSHDLGRAFVTARL